MRHCAYRQTLRFLVLIACSLPLATPSGASEWAGYGPGASPRSLVGKGVSQVAADLAKLSELPEELECLALNIYWEARSEPLEGKLAVAAVTMNRVAHDAFPDSVCEVVRQGGEDRRHACQFSWWCDGRSDTPENPAAWAAALELARHVLAEEHDDPSGQALWYHADHVRPKWSVRKRRTALIGKQVFYGEPAR